MPNQRKLENSNISKSNKKSNGKQLEIRFETKKLPQAEKIRKEIVQYKKVYNHLLPQEIVALKQRYGDFKPNHIDTLVTILENNKELLYVKLRYLKNKNYKKNNVYEKKIVKKYTTIFLRQTYDILTEINEFKELKNRIDHYTLLKSQGKYLASLNTEERNEFEKEFNELLKEYTYKKEKIITDVAQNNILTKIILQKL